MSILSASTEKKALLLLAKCLPYIAALSELKMEAADAFNCRTAENLIKGIIEDNGYQPVYGKGRGITVKKINATKF